MSMSCMAGMSTGTATCHWPENHPNNHYRNAAHLSQSKEKSPTFLKRPFSRKKTSKKNKHFPFHPLFLAKNCTVKKKKKSFLGCINHLNTQPNPLNPPNPTVPNCTHLQGWCTTWLTWKLKSSTRPSRLIRAFGLKGCRSEMFPKKEKTWKKWGRKLLPRHPKGLGKWMIKGWFKGLLMDYLRDYLRDCWWII